jgi:hypothetical protein
MRRARVLRALLDGLAIDPEVRGLRLAHLAPDAWPSVLSLANAHRLAPALYAELAGAGRLKTLPPDVRQYLGLLYGANGRRNEAIRRQAVQLVTALNAAGIRPLLLKGVLTLLVDRGRDSASRMMSDIDFAVPRSRRRAAETTLWELGYRSANSDAPGPRAIGDFHRGGDPASLDLHLELIDQDYILPAAEVFARARPARAESAAFLVPSATHRLMHALLHGQIHHLGQFYRWRLALDQLYDFALIAMAERGDANWRGMQACLAAHRLTCVLESYLLAARDLFGLPWPLDRPPAASARRHVAYCKAQLRNPVMARLAVPVGNARAAFAWHRMRARYGDRGGPALWRLTHAIRYLKGHGPSDAFIRLLR